MRNYSQSMVRSSGCSRLFLHRLDGEVKGRVGSQSVLATLGTAPTTGSPRTITGHCLSRGVATDVTSAREMALRIFVGSGLDGGHQMELVELCELLAEQEPVDPTRPTRFELKLGHGRFYGTVDRVATLEANAAGRPTFVELTDYKSG